MQKQVLEALTSGRLKPTNVIMGDYVEHKIENVEAGGIGFQIIHGKEDEEDSPYPKRGDYAGVLAWLETQKKREGIDYFVAAGRNRSEMCRKLTKIFGWEVSSNSLQKLENRKKITDF